MTTTFLRVLEADDKAAALLDAIHQPEGVGGQQRFDVEPHAFSAMPLSPFAYHASARILRLWGHLRTLDGTKVRAAKGAYTNDDQRFVKLWLEVPPEAVVQAKAFHDAKAAWAVFSKGGSFSPFYSDIATVLAWGRDGEQAKAFLATYRDAKGWGYNWSACLNGYQDYFRPGLTWPRRTQSGLALRAMPGGCIFGDKGPAVFVSGDSNVGLMSLLAIVNSPIFRALVDLQMCFGSYEVGVIQRTPVPDLSTADEAVLAALAQHAWSLKRSLDTRNETSHAFALPALLQASGGTLHERAAAWSANMAAANAALRGVQSEIDDKCFDLYGIGGEDRRRIEQDFGAAGVAATEGGPAGEEEDDDA